ncbi:hypothetical protein [Mycolicibacterium sp.]|uniref:hypothetical protein n=1 Tax=Mycolicibacterium sp. TaxID=2320850 RepID=UPI003D0D7DFB
MESTIIAIVAVLVLSVWHLHNRRHASWRVSADGRFSIYCGYALVIFAVYWMVSAPTLVAWEWALGNVWALAAMLAFVNGFGTLNRVTAEHAWMAQFMESIEPSTGAVPRQS